MVTMGNFLGGPGTKALPALLIQGPRVPPLVRELEPDAATKTCPTESAFNKVVRMVHFMS